MITVPGMSALKRQSFESKRAVFGLKNAERADWQTKSLYFEVNLMDGSSL